MRQWGADIDRTRWEPLRSDVEEAASMYREGSFWASVETFFFCLLLINNKMNEEMQMSSRECLVVLRHLVVLSLMRNTNHRVSIHQQ